jgi:hypothetical protein
VVAAVDFEIARGGVRRAVMREAVCFQVPY